MKNSLQSRILHFHITTTTLPRRTRNNGFWKVALTIFLSMFSLYLLAQLVNIMKAP